MALASLPAFVSRFRTKKSCVSSDDFGTPMRPASVSRHQSMHAFFASMHFSSRRIASLIWALNSSNTAAAPAGFCAAARRWTICGWRRRTAVAMATELALDAVIFSRAAISTSMARRAISPAPSSRMRAFSAAGVAFSPACVSASMALPIATEETIAENCVFAGNALSPKRATRSARISSAISLKRSGIRLA